MPISPINIDQLTEEELRDLNHRIVERLRIIQQLRAHGAMMKFSIGDRVFFRAADGRQISGTLVQYNRKTVTVVCADGTRWTVSPGLLIRVESVGNGMSAHAEVRDITVADGNRGWK